MTAKGEKVIAMVGLGHMGSALAESLLEKSFPVTVWNRTPSKADQFKNLGSTVSANVVEAAQKSDVMVVCLLDHIATRNTIMSHQVGLALKGKVLVQLSTTTKDEVDELAEWADTFEIRLLKGGIMVYPNDIRAGNGAVLYGNGLPPL